MRKLFLIITAFYFMFPSYSFALTITPTVSEITPTKSSDKVNQAIDNLKDKVASRVAELKLVEKKGVIGTVEKVSDTQITINDLNDTIRIIDVDELTKFSSSDNNSYGISDIKKGIKISVLGLYNKQSERLLARFVNEITIPLFIHGVVTKKDDENFNITLSTEDGTNYLVDIENITKTFAYNDSQFDSSGYTKIKIMENALVIGFPDPKEKNKIIASRIIIFPDVPKNPKVPIIQDLPTPTPSPSPTQK